VKTGAAVTGSAAAGADGSGGTSGGVTVKSVVSGPKESAMHSAWMVAAPGCALAGTAALSENEPSAAVWVVPSNSLSER